MALAKPGLVFLEIYSSWVIRSLCWKNFPSLIMPRTPLSQVQSFFRKTQLLRVKQESTNAN